METNKDNYIVQLEEELKRCKQVIVSQEKTIERLIEQSAAAKIILTDLEPSNLM